jgi:hypothetical protein
LPCNNRAAVALSLTLASAQTVSSRQAASSPAAQTNRGRAQDNGRKPDKPTTTSDAGKAPQTATITGCVVRDAANGGQATIASNGISYKLTGKRDTEFDQYLGKRVEVTGALDSGSTAARATSGKADETGAPKDQTAVGGQSDVPATGTTRDNTVPDAGANNPAARESVPLATDKGTTADLTGRLRVRTIRLVASNCL